MPKPKIRAKTTTPARKAKRSIYRSRIIQAEEPRNGLALEKAQNVLCVIFGYVKDNVSAVGEFPGSHRQIFPSYPVGRIPHS